MFIMVNRFVSQLLHVHIGRRNLHATLQQHAFEKWRDIYGSFSDVILLWQLEGRGMLLTQLLLWI